MIFIGLGSNLGNRDQHIQQSLHQLQAYGCVIRRISSMVETPPWGLIEQPSFINAVCEIDFTGSAPDLLDILQKIENDMGRIRTEKWGPRVIDLDILEFNREIHLGERLTLPHPFYPERTFVLEPLAELEPHWVPTGYRNTVSELWALALAASKNIN